MWYSPYTPNRSCLTSLQRTVYNNCSSAALRPHSWSQTGEKYVQVALWGECRGLALVNTVITIWLRWRKGDCKLKLWQSVVICMYCFQQGVLKGWKNHIIMRVVVWWEKRLHWYYKLAYLQCYLLHWNKLPPESFIALYPIDKNNKYLTSTSWKYKIVIQ